jgi:hypothetical protein
MSCVALTIATADARACPGDEVQVTVVSVLATDKDDKVDKKLVQLADCIRAKKPELTGFRIGQQSREPVELGKGKEFPFADNDKRKVIVTVRHGADDNNKVGLTIKVPCCAEIDYKICCGKFFPVETCYKTKDGKCLYIAIMVQPCKGK